MHSEEVNQRGANTAEWEFNRVNNDTVQRVRDAEKANRFLQMVGVFLTSREWER